MKIILQQIGNQIHRQFVKPRKDSWLTEFESLKPSVLPKAHRSMNYRRVHFLLKRDNYDVFFKLVKVPWYFEEIGRHVFKSTETCTLRVKGCGEFYFIQLCRGTKQRTNGLIGTPFFHRYTREDNKRIPSKPSSSDKQKAWREDLRGPGDLLLFLSTALAGAKRGEAVIELLDWFELELRISEIKVKRGQRTITVAPKLRWPSPNEVWEWPGDPDKYFVQYTESAKDKILVASPNVREAVAQIAEVWHNPSATSVLISAWTGSGKDPLQKLFMHGMAQEDSPEFSAPSMKSAEKEIGDALLKRANKRTLKLRRRTVVFIDEIHQPSAQEVRENLLRCMESGKYRCGEPRKTYSFKENLMYLFAASEAPEELRQLAPVDFWTRIDHMIKMSHPLALKSHDERRLVLCQYFGMFWRETLKDAKPKKPKNQFTIHDLLEKPECVTVVGDKFAVLLDSPFIPIISMRMMRSIVQRIASLAMYEIKTEVIKFEARVIKKADPKKVGENISKRVEVWTQNLFEEIVPSLQPKGAF